MNYFIIVGSVVIYISVYIRVIPTNDEEVWKWMCGVSVPLMQHGCLFLVFSVKKKYIHSYVCSCNGRTQTVFSWKFLLGG